MDFYYFDMSPPCRSVMLTAKAIGITLNKKFVDLLAEEQMKPNFVALNPQHCLPTLIDGDLTLWERLVKCVLLSFGSINLNLIYTWS